MSERPTVDEVRRGLARQLALPARISYVALLLVSLAATGVVGSLLLTEPALPLRIRAAFGGMVLIGLAWAAFAGWVLTRRHVLYAKHRIVAGRMAVGFAAIFTIGTLAIGTARGMNGPWYGALAVGLLMLVLAAVQLLRARRRYAELSARRRELERQIGSRGGEV